MAPSPGPPTNMAMQRYRQCQEAASYGYEFFRLAVPEVSKCLFSKEVQKNSPTAIEPSSSDAIDKENLGNKEAQKNRPAGEGNSSQKSQRVVRKKHFNEPLGNKENQKNNTAEIEPSLYGKGTPLDLLADVCALMTPLEVGDSENKSSPAPTMIPKAAQRSPTPPIKAHDVSNGDSRLKILAEVCSNHYEKEVPTRKSKRVVRKKNYKL